MPPKFIGKRENWGREADREYKRRDKAAVAETKKRERTEYLNWDEEIRKEKIRRDKAAAAETRTRERTEFLKWSKEIQSEETRREKLRDLSKTWNPKNTKKWVTQYRRRFRRKLEKRSRRLPSFDVVKTYSNANAKFTTYFDTYKIYVYGRVDPVAVFKKALDLAVEARKLKPGDKIRIIVSHPSWAKPFSTKLITITDDEQFFISF